MRYAIIVLALLGILAAPRPADAVVAVTGNQMLAACEKKIRTYNLNALGWHDAFITAGTVGMSEGQERENPKMGVCLHEEATARQIADVLLKYTTRPSRKAPQPPNLLTLMAMREAFPCR